MRADDPRLLAIGREAPGMLVAVGFVEETDEHRYCNSVALLRDGELVGLHRKVYLPTYGLFDEGRFTRAGDRVRTVSVGEPIGRIGLSACARTSGIASLPMIQALDGASLLVNIAAGPSRAPGSERRAGGDRRLAQDAGHVRAARHRRARLLQPGRQRGGADLLGRLADLAADGSTVVRRRSGRRRSWSGRSRPMTCACSATACRSSPTSGSSSSAASSTGSSPSAPGSPALRPRAEVPVAATALPPLPAIEPAQAIEVIVGFIRAQMAQTGF